MIFVVREKRGMNKILVSQQNMGIMQRRSFDSLSLFTHKLKEEKWIWMHSHSPKLCSTCKWGNLCSCWWGCLGYAGRRESGLCSVIIVETGNQHCQTAAGIGIYSALTLSSSNKRPCIAINFLISHIPQTVVSSWNWTELNNGAENTDKWQRSTELHLLLSRRQWNDLTIDSPPC